MRNDTSELTAVYEKLGTLSAEMIRRSARPMASGETAFPPQVETHYEAFWLRDYAYMLEGSSGAFSADECRNACRLFVSAMKPDGSCVDCIKFDGTPIYMPGYGSMGEEPVADGSQFTVDVAWHTWKKTGDAGLVAEIAPALVRAMRAVPRNPRTGLVRIEPGERWERCPYGFTDTIRKQGDLLFSSLLFIQAARQLTGLLETAGIGGGDEWLRTARTVSRSVVDTLTHGETGLLLAATDVCRQPDIWGSAFAVFLGVCDGEQSDRIAGYFAREYDGLVSHGQVRHLPPGSYWGMTGAKPDTYQNGGYWATPTGWFAYALARSDRDAAVRMFADLTADFDARGVNEWVFGDTLGVPGYTASAALPRLGIRALLHGKKPEWAYPG